MSLYKRGDVWWYDFTDANGKRHRKATGLRSKTAAKIAEDRARERAFLGSSHRPVPTIEQAADKWFLARMAGRKSEKTTAQRLNIMLRLIGPTKLVSEIDAPEIAEAIAIRRTETTRQGKLPANATVNRDLIDSTLRPVLTYAKEVLKAPTQDIAWSALKLPEPRDRDRAFTAEEIRAWRAALPEWHRPVFDFAARYGVRLKEAFFPPSAVDASTGRVFLRKRKNGKAHAVRLQPDDLASIMARVTRATEAELDTIWYRDRGGKLTPIRWRGFQSASRRALDDAKIADARPAHDLRHHAATVLQRRTGNLGAVKRLLGHENIASTMRYAHADDDDVFEAMRHAYATPPIASHKASSDDEPEASRSMNASSSGTG